MTEGEREDDEIQGEPIPWTGRRAPSGKLDDRRVACPFCEQRGWMAFAQVRALLINKLVPWAWLVIGAALGYFMGHR